MKPEKRYLGVVVLCLIAAILVVGSTMLVNQRIEREVSDAKETITKEEVSHTKKANEVVKNTQPNSEKPSNHKDEEATLSAEKEKEIAINNAITKLAFNEESSLLWPVNGPVLLEYNMEHTIYFPTLDHYQCNPALVLQSEVDQDVLCSATGVITEISSNEEIGKYVVMAIGDGYTLTYGQLSGVKKEVGDMIETGEVLGVTATPTKYYTVEGANLYFEMKKDGQSIDPLNFIQYE